MYLDTPSFFAAIVILSLTNAIMMMIGWLEDRRVAAFAFWAGAHLASALGSALLATGSGLSKPAVIVCGMLMMSLHYALNLRGVQVFEGRRTPGIYAAWPVMIPAGAILSLGVDEAAAGWALMLTGILASVAIAYEFWRAEKGPIRWLTTIFLLLHAAFQASSGGDPMQGHSELWHVFFVVDIICYGGGISALCLLIAQRRATRELRRLASTDELTNMPNRRAFFASANSALQALCIERKPASMLMFDLDGFKSINDQHGHPAGDQVLRSFAALLRTQLGQVPTGRLGGEEFAALLPMPASDAAALAARIGMDVATAAVSYDGVRIPVTVSIGISAEQAVRSELRALLASADNALYRAKANGRNRVEVNILDDNGSDREQQQGPCAGRGQQGHDGFARRTPVRANVERAAAGAMPEHGSFAGPRHTRRFSS